MMHLSQPVLCAIINFPYAALTSKLVLPKTPPDKIPLYTSEHLKWAVTECNRYITVELNVILRRYFLRSSLHKFLSQVWHVIIICLPGDRFCQFHRLHVPRNMSSALHLIPLPADALLEQEALQQGVHWNSRWVKIYFFQLFSWTIYSVDNVFVSNEWWLADELSCYWAEM